MTVADGYDPASGLRAATEFGRSDTKFARFALPYRIAISMLTTKVRILKQEFGRRDGYCPIEVVSSRVKTLHSVVAKARHVRCPLTADDIRTNILDIAGVRVTWSPIGHVPDRSPAQRATARHCDRGRRLHRQAETQRLKGFAHDRRNPCSSE